MLLEAFYKDWTKAECTQTNSNALRPMKLLKVNFLLFYAIFKQ